MREGYRYTGLLLMVTGLLHTAIGVNRLVQLFGEVQDTGFFDSISGNIERGRAFWFTFTGLMMLLTGYLMDWIVRKKNLLLPSEFGYSLTGLCLIGVIMLPNSGFWLVMLQGIYLAVFSAPRS